MSRKRKRYTAGLAVVAALALSGCSMHPSSAALVNDSDISQNKVDDLVHAACSYTEAQRLKGGTVPSPATSTAYLRHVLLQNLITFQITDDAARSLGLTVSPAMVSRISGSNPLPASISSADAAALADFFHDSALSQLQVATIGQHIKDPSVTTADKVTPGTIQADTQAAQKFLSGFTQAQHVDVNPAFGSWNGDVLVDSLGSLSAPRSVPARRWLALRETNAQSVDGLPPSQVCG